MTTRTTTFPPSRTHADRQPTLLPVGADTWRALDPWGRALGHVRREQTPAGDRFRAMRFHAATRSFRTVGEFWSSADAVDSLRYSR